MKTYMIGADIGGTSIKVGLFDQSKTLLEKWEITTDTSNDGVHIIEDLACFVNRIIHDKKIAINEVTGIGVGIPGPVTEDGVVHTCVNLGWGRKDVVGELTEKLGIVVKAGNDANVAALGEWKCGGGAGQENIVMITLGTGVGGGIIQHGKIITGHNGAAAEIGHITMNYEEVVPCNCGRNGCLEQYASATGLVRYSKQYLLDHPLKPSILRKFDALSAKDIVESAKQQDDIAVMCIEYIAQLLGRALAQLACVINPDMFVIGGGLSLAGDILLNRIRYYYRNNAFPQSKNTAIFPAALGNDAGIYGCVELL